MATLSEYQAAAKAYANQVRHTRDAYDAFRTAHLAWDAADALEKAALAELMRIAKELSGDVP